MFQLPGRCCDEVGLVWCAPTDWKMLSLLGNPFPEHRNKRTVRPTSPELSAGTSQHFTSIFFTISVGMIANTTYDRITAKWTKRNTVKNPQSCLLFSQTGPQSHEKSSLEFRLLVAGLNTGLKSYSSSIRPGQSHSWSHHCPSYSSSLKQLTAENVVLSNPSRNRFHEILTNICLWFSYRGN